MRNTLFFFFVRAVACVYGQHTVTVKDFIERLESNGIEVWWDNELGYGDSLIDIFEKGIKIIIFACFIYINHFFSILIKFLNF